MTSKQPPAACVTGTGRSGTKYVCEVLAANGVRAGHEDWFMPPTHWGDRVDALDVDVSWLAVPFIEQAAWTGPVCLVTRHPVATVRALVGAYFLSDVNSDWTKFALAHELRIHDLPWLERAVEWWVRWNSRAMDVADVMFRVEDLSRSEASLTAFGRWVGADLSLEASSGVPTATHHGGRIDVDPEYVWGLLDGRAEWFGYSPDEEP